MSFCHFFRIWASLRWWREAQIRTKCKKIEKHSKIDPKKDAIFIRIRSFSWFFFRWFLEESWEVFFCALVAEMFQMGGYLGTLFQLCCSKAGKLKTSVSCTPNTTFQTFLGTGFGHLGQLFPTSFLGWVLRRGFTIFLRNWGSSRSSKDDFWWAFQGHISRWFVMTF